MWCVARLAVGRRGFGEDIGKMKNDCGCEKEAEEGLIDEAGYSP
jgi:hypothetical protein